MCDAGCDLSANRESSSTCLHTRLAPNTVLLFVLKVHRRSDLLSPEQFGPGQHALPYLGMKYKPDLQVNCHLVDRNTAHIDITFTLTTIRNPSS